MLQNHAAFYMFDSRSNAVGNRFHGIHMMDKENLINHLKMKVNLMKLFLEKARLTKGAGSTSLRPAADLLWKVQDLESRRIGFALFRLIGSLLP